MTNAKLTLDQAEDLGGKYWTLGDLERVYFDKDMWMPLIRLDVSYYGTGNVKGATLGDDNISNTRAARLLGAKVYLNVTTGRLHCDADPEYAALIIAAIVAKAGGGDETAKHRAALATLHTLVAEYVDAAYDNPSDNYKAKAVQVVEQLVGSGLLSVLDEALGAEDKG